MGFGGEDCDNGDVFEGIYKQAASAAPARGEVALASNDEQWTLSGDDEEKDPFAAAVLGEGIEGIQSEGAGLDDLDAGEDPEDELKRQQNKAREKELMAILKGLMGGDCDWGNAQVGAEAQRLVSACRSESHDLELQIKEYQEKIDSCKGKIDKAKVETIADDELNALQSKMQEKLQEEKQLREELRVVNDELDDLDRQRVSIKERRMLSRRKRKTRRKQK